MALSCGQIAKNIVASACGAGAVGLDNYIYLINYDDIDRANCVENNGVITDIVLKSGANGYKYESNHKGFEGTSALNRGTYAVAHDHSVVGRIFLNSQTIKDELNKLALGKFVAVVRNLNNVDEVKYEVYCWNNGLVCTAMDKNTTDGDGVFYSFTLASNEGERESDLPKSFYKTDLSTTESALEALLPSA